MDDSSTTRRCPACGAELRAGDTACARCGRSEANPFVAPTAKDEPPPPGWPGPAYAIGVVCVAAALAWPAPGLAIAWVVVATPALMRTAIVIRRRRKAGLPISGADRATALFASVGATLLAGIAASIAFVAVCFPIGLFFFDINLHPSDERRARTEIGMTSAFILGGVAALVAGYYLFKRLWPRQPDHPAREATNVSGSEQQRPAAPPPSEGVS